MDDDEKIARSPATMLESLDYKFDLARNGEEAIQFYKRYLNIGRPYDAVIMDLTVIGGMGGEETFSACANSTPTCAPSSPAATTTTTWPGSSSTWVSAAT